MRILKILPVFPVVAILGATAAVSVPDPHMIIFPDSKNSAELYERLAKVALNEESQWVRDQMRIEVPGIKTAWIDYDGGRPCTDCHPSN